MSLLRTRAPLFSSPPCPTHGGPYFFRLGHVGPWGTIWFSSYIGLVDRANRPQNLVQTVFIQPASVEDSCFQEGPVRPCPRNVRALKSAFFAILPRPSPWTTTPPPPPPPPPPDFYLCRPHLILHLGTMTSVNITVRQRKSGEIHKTNWAKR